MLSLHMSLLSGLMAGYNVNDQFAFVLLFIMHHITYEHHEDNTPLASEQLGTYSSLIKLIVYSFVCYSIVNEYGVQLTQKKNMLHALFVIMLSLVVMKLYSHTLHEDLQYTFEYITNDSLFIIGVIVLYLYISSD